MGPTQYGYTNQGQQLANFNAALQSIVNMPPQNIPTSTAKDLYSGAQAGALNMQVNQPGFASQDRQNLIQQSGIPGLIGSQGNLSQLFDLYLHDNNLSQQYSSAAGGGTGSVSPYQNPQLLASSAQAGQNLTQGNQADINAVAGATTPNQPGTTTSVTAPTPAANNPYLGSSSDVLASVANAPQSPSLTTYQEGQPLNANNNIMGLINSLIGSEGTLVGQKSDTDVQAYTAKMNALQSVANILGGVLQTQQAQAQNPAGVVGSKAQAGATFNQLVDDIQKAKGGNATERDVWDYINQHDSALRAQGVNVDELWKLHSDMAKKVGQNGAISGGTTAPKVSQSYSKPEILNQFQTMKAAYQAAANNPLDPTAYNNYTAQRNVLSDILAYGLTKSRSWQTVKRMLDVMPDPRNFNPFDTASRYGAEGAFKGMESQLNSAANQEFGGDKSGSGGTTVMTSPDGKQYNVPSNKVKEAQQHGWK